MGLTEELKRSIDVMTLEDLGESILAEMRNKPVLSREACEFLLQAYANRLSELY